MNEMDIAMGLLGAILLTAGNFFFAVGVTGKTAPDTRIAAMTVGVLAVVGGIMMVALAVSDA